MQKKYISTLHRGFHTSTKNDHNWTLSPKGKFEYIPNHDCGHDDDAKAKGLIGNLEPIIIVSIWLNFGFDMISLLTYDPWCESDPGLPFGISFRESH